MKILSENKAIDVLSGKMREFAKRIRSEYEYKAKSCATCETKGACCLDAHFVNVHITRLEAAAIRKTLNGLDERVLRRVEARIEAAIEKYGLDAEGDTSGRTFACPLFEPGIGCVVHDTAKPAPCVIHACYENEADLPPDELLAERMDMIEKLNERTYGERAVWRPLPTAIR